MKKITRRILIILGILFLILKGFEWWLEQNFSDRINSNPGRAYNIEYDDLDLHAFLKGITLDSVRIRPLNEVKGAAKIIGDVDYATLKGLVWADLLFGKSLNIREIVFKQPVFEITLRTDTVKKSSGKGIQDMFGDILSRGDLQSFRIENGSMILKEPETGKVKGSIKKVNIFANELQTDSLQLTNLIPFYLGGLIIDIEDITFDLNEYTHLKLGHIKYNLEQKEINLLDLSMGYSIDWVAVSQKIGIQNDVIEISVKEISILELEPSNSFYSNLDILAQKVLIDSLNIKLQRNKNLTRPPDKVKPMFNGMISSIPIRVEIDSVHILNSTLTYRELGVNKDESGSISFRKINGVIGGLTNNPQKQKKIKMLDADLSANFNDYAPIDININVPYGKEAFRLNAEMNKMDLKELNPMLIPLTGVEVKSGELMKLKYTMDAGTHQSKNNLIFDYQNLQVALIKKKENHKYKKRPMISAIAQAAVKNNNYPEQQNYLTSSYKMERNQYRSPVNYIVQGLIKGIASIVPGKNIGKEFTKDKKKKKKK